jgi:CHRD domain-containing protein/type IX secretion system substrate protein
MKKIKHLITVFFLAALSVASVAQNMLPLPPQVTTFTANTRGYYFTAPVDFTITEIGVPTDASSASQSVVITTLAAPPPNFGANTTNYTTEFLAQNVPGAAMIPCNVQVTAGTVVGILGSRGTNSTNSYGSPNPYNTTLLGQPVTLARYLMQADLQFNWPFPVSSEVGSNFIGRVNITVSAGGGGGGSVCVPDPNNCVTVTCPPDETVACITDVDLDPLLATANSTCGAIEGQWVSNPYISGVPGCPGTTYTYVYRAVDDKGNVGCCERVITIDNTPPVVTVIPGGTVNCFDDISVEISDATITNTCSAYNFYIAAPEVVGAIGCPGTQYIYTYRLVDACGRVVEATRTFTEANNAGPVVTAPDDVTCSCLAGITPNPDNASVTTSCGSGSTVTVTGPQVFGPMNCNGTVYRYTYTATDDCGRTSSDTQDFTINNGPPVFENCPGDNWLVLNCEDYGGEAGTIQVIEAWIASVTASTSCGLPLTVFNNFNSNNINTCVNNGYNTVTFRATDNCGRTSFCTGVYVVVDTEAPNITTNPQDHYEVCNAMTQMNLTNWVQNRGGAIAEDGCSGGNVSWTASPANPQWSGTCGEVEVTFIVTDNCGNKTSAKASFSVLDPLAPTFTSVPADATVECPNDVVFGTPEASDNCGGVTITFEDEITGDDCIGSITRTWTAADDCGNEALASQTISYADTEAPEFTFVPADLTIDCGEDPVFGTPEAEDNCGGVDITFEDETVLSVEGGFSGDQEVPPSGSNGSGIVSGTYNPGTGQLAFDVNYEGLSGNTIVSHIHNAPFGSNGGVVFALPITTGNTSGSYSFMVDLDAAQATELEDGNYYINIHTEAVPSGEIRAQLYVKSCNGSSTRTWTATDDCGNTATASQTITFSDTEAPEFTFVPNDLTFYCVDGDTVDDIPDATAEDNCDDDVTITFVDIFNTGPDGPLDCGNGYGYDLERTWTATDDCGNTATAVTLAWFKGPLSFDGGNNNGLISGGNNEVSKNTFEINPNPVNDKLNILFNSTIEQEATIRVFNILGRVVYSEVEAAAKGVNRTSLSVENFMTGTYFISIEFEDKVITKKFVKS